MTFSVSSVMVPIDFSDASMRALGYGRHIADEFDADLALVHIIPLSIPTLYAYPAPTREWQMEHEAEAERRLRALISKEDADRMRCRFVARCGHIDEELLRLIGEAKTDLIVMGSHGRRAFQRWLLGSVTENLLRKAPVPILTVTHTEHEASWPFQKILAATDLSVAASTGVEIAAELARVLDSVLTVLHVTEHGLEKGSRPTELVPPNLHGIEVDKRILAGTPHEVIVRFAEENDFDLIVLTLQGRSFLNRALLGATAERVIRSSYVPVLSIPYSLSAEESRGKVS